ncbi:unnamed protein product [Ectocarpus sp. 8 AP-2014]
MRDVGIINEPDEDSDYASYQHSGGCVWTAGTFTVNGDATLCGRERPGSRRSHLRERDGIRLIQRGSHDDGNEHHRRLRRPRRWHTQPWRGERCGWLPLRGHLGELWGCYYLQRRGGAVPLHERGYRLLQGLVEP